MKPRYTRRVRGTLSAGGTALAAAMTWSAPPCAAQECVWRASNPDASWGRVMATDEVRRETVLYWARVMYPFPCETWTWDGDRWTLRGTEGPPARDQAAMVFDAARGETLLFGGLGGVRYGDTWTWDGARWTLETTDGPSPRRAHAMAYDPARGEVVLFGGRAAELSGETWIWNGEAWRLASTTGPAARARHGMAYDPISGEVLLCCGANDTQFLSDTWSWDGGAWTLRSPGNSLFRAAGAAMALDDSSGSVIRFGGDVPDDGLNNGVTDETYAWDGTAWHRVHSAEPGARSSCGMAPDPVRPGLILFGGYDGLVSHYSDMWRWSSGDWELMGLTSLEIPYPVGPLVFDSVRAHALFVPQGEARDSWPWVWDGSLWRASDMPRRRLSSGGAAAFDEARGQLVLLSGASTWLWDGEQWHERVVPGPGERLHHAMAFDRAGGHVLLFGGSTGGNAAGDTWLWDGDAWTHAAAQGPSPRWGAALAFDEAGGRLVLFGGTDGTELSGQTWGWTGFGWELLSEDGPSPRFAGAMAYAPQVGGLLLTGGTTGEYEQPLADSWLWRGGAWSEISLDGLSGRAHHSMRLDTADEELMAFGGKDGPNHLADLRVFVLDCGDACRVDWNGDSSVDTRDVVGFLLAWANGEPGADWDGDGTIGAQDVIAFLSDWGAGC